MPMPAATRTLATTLTMIVVLAVALPAKASPPECTCNNLTSLQQDYRNAVALEAYFRGLEKHMQEVEEGLDDFITDMNKIKSESRKEYSDYQQKYPTSQVMTPVDGYKGPPSIEMIEGTCNQKPRDLAKLEAGSPCKAIADAALNHEAFHSANCTNMEGGAKAYWNRLWSEVAHEEAEGYKRQAAELKDELRRVLDVSEVTYSGDWTLGINIGGMAQYGYRYTAQSEDIGGASGGDKWTMTGKGTGTVNWIRAILMGKSCSTSGEMKSNYTTKITTDGLTFDLEVEALSSSGALSIKCPGPGGGGGYGADAGGGGMIATGLPVKAGVTILPGDMGSEIRNILAGAGTVSGSGKRELSVTCSAP